MRDRLEKLHGELVAAGARNRAHDVAKILQKTALQGVAEYTRRMSMFFVQTGPRSFDQAEWAAHEKQIKALADKIDTLANEDASYEQFEEVLGRLRDLGFFPDAALVSDAARAFSFGEATC